MTEMKRLSDKEISSLMYLGEWKRCNYLTKSGKVVLECLPLNGKDKEVKGI